jgi:hypothetical protein
MSRDTRGETRRSAAIHSRPPIRQRGKTSSSPRLDLAAQLRELRGRHASNSFYRLLPIAWLKSAGREHAAKRVAAALRVRALHAGGVHVITGPRVIRRGLGAQGGAATASDVTASDEQTRRRLHRRSPSRIERCIFAPEAVDHRADASVCPRRRAWSREDLRARAPHRGSHPTDLRAGDWTKRRYGSPGRRGVLRGDLRGLAACSSA